MAAAKTMVEQGPSCDSLLAAFRKQIITDLATLAEQFEQALTRPCACSRVLRTAEDWDRILVTGSSISALL